MSIKDSCRSSVTETDLQPCQYYQKGATMHSGIYILVLMLCVRSGSSAPHGRKNERNSDKKQSENCSNIKRQFDRIFVLLNDITKITTFEKANNELPMESKCTQTKCGVLEQLAGFYSCDVTFPNDMIKKELLGLIQNLQMQRYLKEDTCHLPDASCPSEVQQLSMWNKIELLQAILMCLQSLEDICLS